VLLPCCKEPVIVEEDPFKINTLTPLKDDIPDQILGSGKIVFNRLHGLNLDNCGFYVIDIDKKKADGFRFTTGTFNPNISPDGTRIAFSLYTNKSIYDIFIMDIDGSDCYPVYQWNYHEKQDW